MSKYYKYKLKYLELKGGMLSEPQRVFYVYTTGIAEWGDLTKTFEYWQSVLGARICSFVPIEFNAIHIIHCDTLVSITNKSERISIKARINGMLTDNPLPDPRIKVSRFQTEPLDFDQVKTNPHIVVDLAHIFSYSGPSTVYISGHYREPVGSPIQINCVYFGYVGEDQIEYDSKMSKRYITRTNFINIDSEGRVTTYITKLFDPARFEPLDPDELSNPSERITRMMKNIRKKNTAKFRANDGNLVRFDSIFTDSNISIHAGMVNAIVNMIMTTELTQTQIEDSIVDQTTKIFITSR
jgi:hypothetical protein